MRARIFVRKTGKQTLPFDYQYHLAGMLLTKLKAVDLEFASELHNSTNFKFYTFSYLMGLKPHYTRQSKPRGHGLHFQEANFILSSPDRKFIRSFCEGLLELPEFHLGG